MQLSEHLQVLYCTCHLLLVHLLLRLGLRVLLGELDVHHRPRHLVVLRRRGVVVLVALGEQVVVRWWRWW